MEKDFPRNGNSLDVVDRPPACESEVLGGVKGVAKVTVSPVDGSMVPLWVNRIAADHWSVGADLPLWKIFAPDHFFAGKREEVSVRWASLKGTAYVPDLGGTGRH